MNYPSNDSVNLLIEYEKVGNGKMVLARISYGDLYLSAIGEGRAKATEFLLNRLSMGLKEGIISLREKKND